MTLVQLIRGTLLTGIPILLMVAVIEWLWRHHKLHHEVSRKLIHISAGVYVAFWPLFLSWQVIGLLSLCAIMALIASRRLSMFDAMHGARDNGIGEVLAAASIGLLTLITHDQAIYMVCLLQMVLADGLAAIIGSQYGGKHRYKVFGANKSIAGTGTFFVSSLIIMIAYVVTTNSSVVFLGLPILLTILENVSIKGGDNLTVPLACALILSLA